MYLLTTTPRFHEQLITRRRGATSHTNSDGDGAGGAPIRIRHEEKPLGLEPLEPPGARHGARRRQRELPRRGGAAHLHLVLQLHAALWARAEAEQGQRAPLQQVAAVEQQEHAVVPVARQQHAERRVPVHGHRRAPEAADDGGEAVGAAVVLRDVVAETQAAVGAAADGAVVRRARAGSPRASASPCSGRPCCSRSS